MAYLRAIKGFQFGQIFPLEKDEIVVGRNPDCQLVLNIGAISRHHLRFTRVDEKYYVEDLGSLNGTTVNGIKIDSTKALDDGDQVGLCEVVFAYHSGVPDSREMPPVELVDEPGDSGSIISGRVEVADSMTGYTESNVAAKLHAIIEISKKLANATKLEEVLDRILDSLFDVFPQAERGFIVLDRRGGRLDVAAFLSRDEDVESGKEPSVRISRTMIRHAMDAGEGLLLTDASEDSRFAEAESIVNYPIRSVICVPLISSGGKSLGVIQLDSSLLGGRFTHSDLDVLAVIAGQLAMAIENAQLHEVELREQALERELEVAHHVQHGLLPTEVPRIDGYEFYAYYHAAHMIGGDYYDFIPLSDGRLAIVVADVSGKGIAAALVMARLSAETRYLLATNLKPCEMLERLNKVAAADTFSGRFVTCVIGVLDPAASRVTIINAGHMHPIRLSATGELSMLEGERTQFPLGWFDSTEYCSFDIDLAAGESIFFYSDGVTDAESPKGDQFEMTRLTGRLAGRTGGPDKIGRWLIDELRHFIGTKNQADDITLAGFGRNGVGSG